MSEVLIKVENVSKKFCKDLKRSLWYGMTDIARSVMGGAPTEDLREGEFWAVRDVSFEVRRGECLGLIGHNGAGKSTLLKMLNGLINPDEGRIEMHGKIGALIELGAGFNPILTGRENVYNNGAVLGFSKAEIDKKFDDIVAFAEIEDFIDMPVQNYSSGMKVRLGFAIASQLEPDILILDEVLAVGDAAFRIKCFNRISEIIKSSAVVFVSHSMQQITRICNKLVLMKAGHVVEQGHSLGKIISQYHVGSVVANSMDNRVSIEAEIFKISLLGNDFLETSVLQYGSPYNIEVNFQVFNYTEKNELKILIVISDLEQINVAQIIETIEIPLINKKKYSAKFNFDFAMFNSGKYYFNIALLRGEKGEIIASLFNTTHFVVESEISGFSGMIIKPKFANCEIKKD
ncbi:polysaccharide ABC transporter ATP-binding protein [Fulvivirgaceae bacterium LMO-SS25]